MLKYRDLDLSVKAPWLSRVKLGLLGLDCASPCLDIFYCRSHNSPLCLMLCKTHNLRQLQVL